MAPYSSQPRRREGPELPFTLSPDVSIVDNPPSLSPMLQPSEGLDRGPPRRPTKTAEFEPDYPSFIGLVFNIGSGVKWHYDNRQTEEDWVIWEKLRPHTRVLRMIYNNTYEKNWVSYAIQAWLKSQLKEAPKMERVEFCTQYTDGFVEDRFFNYDGEAEIRRGLEHHVFREIAVRVWAIPLVKEMGIILKDQDGKGDRYHYIQRQVDGWDQSPLLRDGFWGVGARNWSE